MVEQIHIMVSCPYIGCPRSIGYCFKCDYKKGIINYDLTCGYRDAIKKLKDELKTKENIINNTKEKKNE